ncbi:MAG: class I SAM-dependent methyltransferase [Nitrosomonadales bacterium]|nr:class I SAM-dependent methyltransferase [Nitrosomonadales bacterium]MBK9162205.1 class I SAM-dependent methyltransferase [Nitrosomonadales bacterium]
MSNPETRYLDTCPVGCAAPLETTQYVLPEGALLRCSACGQLVSQCSEEHYWQSMQEFDDPQGTLPVAGSEQRRVRRSRKFLDRIAKLLDRAPGEIRLLDVGCSSGAFLHTAVALGFQAEGVEPAPKAATTAQAAGLKVHQGLLQDAGYADGQFDAVTLFEVIEHLKHPQELLRECRRILRPGGILLVGTGNAASWSMGAMGADWEYLSIAKHGGHVSFYTPDSLGRLAQQTGFSVAAIHTRGVRFREKGTCAAPLYRIAKVAGEMMNVLGAWLDKGHDMAVYLRRE